MTFHASGDYIADRRYAWAEAALADGNPVEAAEIAEQVIERAPGYAAAWQLLGRACQGLPGADLSPTGRAHGAFARAIALDPDDGIGACVDLALLGGGGATPSMSHSYVAGLFDGYADRFDAHLVQGLGYRAPALLRDAIERVVAARGIALPFGRCLDLGCGTGLVAKGLAGMAGHVEGVDLSQGMLAKAAALKLYARLHRQDLVGFLAGREAGSADLAVAGDVFVYLRDLGPAFSAAARALVPGGLLAFTLQSHGGEGVVLGPDGRYAHGEAVTRGLAVGAGMEIALLERASFRRQGGVEVPGWVVVLAAGA